MSGQQPVLTLQPSCGCTTVSGAPDAIGELTTCPKGTSSPLGIPRRLTSAMALYASLSRRALASPITCMAATEIRLCT